MNPVVHFEMPYIDGKRMSKFYASAFGWEMQQLGAEMNHYILAKTAEKDAKPGFPSGSIDGGFFLNKPDWPAQYPSIVIGVDDIDKAIKKIHKYGGEVLGEPIEISGIGMYVSFIDTEGNRNSIIEPLR